MKMTAVVQLLVLALLVVHSQGEQTVVSFILVTVYIIIHCNTGRPE